MLRIADERRSNPTTPPVRTNFDILQLRGNDKRELKMPECLVAFPGDEVNAITLVQPRQAEHRRHLLNLAGGKRTDLEHVAEIARLGLRGRAPNGRPDPIRSHAPKQLRAASAGWRSPARCRSRN